MSCLVLSCLVRLFVSRLFVRVSQGVPNANRTDATRESGTQQKMAGQVLTLAPPGVFTGCALLLILFSLSLSRPAAVLTPRPQWLGIPL